ncbi:hypothetical protein FSS13T_11520 [Flavobacterium saliperosum S13]|uniref:Uncharacterized protein n=2 Tax=Flavobacterium saliperosum TaxID=329186 RepID=A0A1G4W3J0_9FLAO|nr:hypothetical protein [Flavobacterium saliperosum]ESU26164.1 hypothetical protein FSS13T_11520 [Flavobacterium saliperosum S13]SCX16194.1 hypothetical protein SAMN02927925_02350 [Flavobacterium saliperosum]
MNKERLQTFLAAFSIAITAYSVNKGISLLPELLQSYNDFRYSLESLYLVFFAFTIVILAILLKVKDKNLDYVGMTFLLITSVKMGLSFFIGRGIVSGTNPNLVEKINFFVIFILFLAIETVITIRLLNKGNGLDKQNINSTKKYF